MPSLQTPADHTNPRFAAPDDLLEGARPLDWSALPGPLFVLVPHADDETLGCGGLLAQGFARGVEIDLLLVTDGTGSHPNARTYGPQRRCEVREAEFGEAIRRLGGTVGQQAFWRKPDTAVPGPEDEATVRELVARLSRKRYATVLTPWREDPHGDHRATTRLLDAALLQLEGPPPRVLQYAVWLGHQGSAADFPAEGAVRVYALEVAGERDVKRDALQAHASQLGRVFDDPTGFELPPSLAATVERPIEYYFEDTKPVTTP